MGLLKGKIERLEESQFISNSEKPILVPSCSFSLAHDTTGFTSLNPNF